MFNYIVNIHNSADHLHQILTGIKDVKSPESKVYCVLDGCTDNSEEIVDWFRYEKIFTPDVRETKAINTALSQIPQIGYNFILQDDVYLYDTRLEYHIKQIYEKLPNIGVLSFRHGSNFQKDALTNGKHAAETDLVVNEHQPDMGIETINEGFITERQVVYKSPICISSEVVAKLGGYDPRFEPIAHDDTEYCIRAYKAGYKNYVCGMKLEQPIEWGGTRRFPEVHQDNLAMHTDHFNLIRQLYGKELEYLGNNHPSLEQIKIW